MTPASSIVVTVNKVIDGDTIDLANGDRIRIIGMNAPERYGSDGHAQPFASQSKAHLQELIRQQGERIRLEYDLEKTDSYGRRLAHLFGEDQKSLTSKMLAAGMAVRATVSPNLRYSKCYQEAEEAARQSLSGLWQSAHFWLKVGQKLSSRDRGFMIVVDSVESVHDSRIIYLASIETWCPNTNFKIESSQGFLFKRRGAVR